jgi:hypothetical protein
MGKKKAVKVEKPLTRAQLVGRGVGHTTLALPERVKIDKRAYAKYRKKVDEGGPVIQSQEAQNADWTEAEAELVAEMNQ